MNTLVAVPTEDEGALIERFVTASHEIEPTLQVTLAKRILLPGSNRVLCLAAKTSVPLSNDDIASVSDLALRLSDGTNVVLSLSSFNDLRSAGPPVPTVVAPRCLSVDRLPFDPYRYAAPEKSRLGPAIFVTLIMAAAVAYPIVTGPLAERFKFRLPALALSGGSGAGATLLLGKRTTPKPQVVKPTREPVPIEEVLPPPQVHPTARPATTPTAVSKNKHRVSKAKTHSTPHYSTNQPASMFVPPPPPAVPLALPPPAMAYPYQFQFDMPPVEKHPAPPPVKAQAKLAKPAIPASTPQPKPSIANQSTSSAPDAEVHLERIVFPEN